MTVKVTVRDSKRGSLAASHPRQIIISKASST